MPSKKPSSLVNIFHWKGCGEIIEKSPACGGKSMSVWVTISWAGGVQSVSLPGRVTSGCIATLTRLSPSPAKPLTAGKFSYSLRRRAHVYVVFKCPSLPPLMHSNWITVSLILPKGNWGLGKILKKPTKGITQFDQVQNEFIHARTDEFITFHCLGLVFVLIIYGFSSELKWNLLGLDGLICKMTRKLGPLHQWIYTQAVR